MSDNNQSIEISATPPQQPRPMQSILAFEKRANEVLDARANHYYNYTDSSGETLSEARTFFNGIRLAPRILKGDLTDIDLSCNLLGTRADVPVIIAPTAFHTMAHKDGEVATAIASGRTGVTYSYNWWLSMRKAEDVLAESGPKWLHLYIFEEREGVVRILREAEERGCFTGIIVSGDHPHNRVQRNMISSLFGPDADPETVFCPNATKAIGNPPLTLGEMQAKQFSGDEVNKRMGHNDFTLSFEDIEWLVGLTDLPVVLKGVLHPDDARRAVACGVKGVVVSNHGGRQMDGSPPAIEILPEIVAAVGDQVDVYVDTGVRKSSDIVKALALGAKAVLLGRPVLYGLACGGADGLTDMFNAMKANLKDDLRALGVKSVEEVGRDAIYWKDHARLFEARDGSSF